jgi:hypothetical protein
MRCIDLRRRRDGIEPRLQRIERLDQCFRIRAQAPELLNRGQHVECRGVAVGVAAVGQRLGLLAAVGAGDVGVYLVLLVGRRAERYVVDKHVAQRAVTDRMLT